MPTKVYGTEAFTVGADSTLNAYAAAWTTFGSSADPSVRASTDDLRYNGTGVGARAKWTGTVNADQKIVATIKTGGATQSYPALTVRMGANFISGYLAQWSPQLGTITVYRVTGSYTQIATLGTVANNTTYTNCYLKATGSGATVTIEFGDDTNGFTTFNDTDAARFTTGQPGVDIYEGTTALTSALDDIEIWDMAAGGASYNQNVSGSITATGALQKLTSKFPSGSITGSGALQKLTSKFPAGSITGTGALQKLTSKFFGGSITTSGNLPGLVGSLTQLCVGSITVTGALAKHTIKLVGGLCSPSGEVRKQTFKKLTGSITATGAVARSFGTFVLKAGSIIASGIVSGINTGPAPIIDRIIQHPTLRRFLGRR